MANTDTGYFGFVHMCADNDYNGNPRRVYTLIDEEGHYVGAWDEGYNGHHAVPGVWRDAAYAAPRQKISVTEYKRILKQIPSPDYADQVEGYSNLRLV